MDGASQSISALLNSPQPALSWGSSSPEPPRFFHLFYECNKTIPDRAKPTKKPRKSLSGVATATRKISLFVSKTSLDGKSSPLNATTTTQSWCWLSCRPPVHLLTFSRGKNPRRSCSDLTASHTWSPTSTAAAGGCPAQGHGVGAQRHLALGNYTGLSFSCAITWQKWA